jgi:hypothetical protein
MFNMGLDDPFGHLRHKLWPKEVKLESQMVVWLPTIKSQELPDFIAFRWHAKYSWKALDKGYNFASNLISIGGLSTKLWAPKVVGVLTLGILELPLGSPRTKWHLSDGPVARHKVYYKGEGGGFSQVWAVVSLMSPCLSMACSCTKMLQLPTNQLVVWFVQIRVSNWIACQSS